MFYPANQRDKQLLPHDPFKAIIAPRPIGWISSVSKSGALNLAPYSFFNAFSSAPPILAFGSEQRKDSVAFIEETGEFTWSMATYDLRFEMNATGASLPRGHSEFDYAGLEIAPSQLVAPPRVAKSPAALECKLIEIIRLKDMHGEKTHNYMVLGQVVGVYIHDEFIQNGMFNTAQAAPIARCGYSDYAVANEMFSIKRPGLML
jgi:flavin reductase (DIM6/NTAB) family NADH-FMN oxidoreductase RutF